MQSKENEKTNREDVDSKKGILVTKKRERRSNENRGEGETARREMIPKKKYRQYEQTEN